MIQRVVRTIAYLKAIMEIYEKKTFTGLDTSLMKVE